MAQYMAIIRKLNQGGAATKVLFTSGKGEDVMPGETTGAIMEMCRASGVTDTSGLTEFQLLRVIPGTGKAGTVQYGLVAEKPMSRDLRGNLGKVVTEDTIPDLPESPVVDPPVQRALTCCSIVNESGEKQYTPYNLEVA